MKYLDALATFWQRNAEIRHGHLPRTGDVLGPEATSPLAAVKQSLLAKAAPYVVAAVLGGGGTIAVPWLLDLLKGKEAPVAVAEEESGSLYQHLEDHDLHLPPPQ